MQSFMRRLCVSMLGLLLMCVSMVYADTPAVATDPKTVEDVKGLLGVSRVLDIRPTQLDGVLEVALPNRTIVYVHLTKKLIISGQIFDVANGNKSLTAERSSELSAAIANRILLEIDRNKAIKVGNGPLVLIEITDVDCSYCRQSEQYFKGKESIFTRYIFLLPSEKNINRTKSILGATDQATAYIKTMEGAYDTQEPPIRGGSEAQVVDRLEHVKRLTEKVEITGTPTFVWPNGMMEGLNTAFFDRLIEHNAKELKK